MEARDRERALSEAEGLENGAKREKKAATDEETHKEAEEMKAALSWDDTLTMEYATSYSLMYILIIQYLLYDDIVRNA